MIGTVSSMEIVDTLKEESYSANEVIRCNPSGSFVWTTMNGRQTSYVICVINVVN